VVDNHNHGYPVATMVMQREDGYSIAHALRILREWNPEWAPKVQSVALESAAQACIASLSCSCLSLSYLLTLPSSLQFFMLDKSRAESNAIEDVFRGATRVLLCKFHMYQVRARLKVQVLVPGALCRMKPCIAHPPVVSTCRPF